jgi:site-specific DNA recombinase
MKNKSSKIIGYSRVSSGQQREEKTIEIQETEIKKYASKKGLQLVKIIRDDGVSGTLAQRPGLAELFSELEKHDDIEGVLIHKLDRLARDLDVQGYLITELKKRNKYLISIQEPDLDSKNPIRRAFMQILSVVAELEKAFIMMRLTAGRIRKAKQGGYPGGLPALGYVSKNKDIAIDEDKAYAVRMIQQQRRFGRKSYRKIASQLNELGIPSPRGGQWYAGTVRYIYKNPVYKGQLRFNKIRAERKDLVIK